MTKICSKCGKEKPLSEFYADKACLSGVRPDCKNCVKARVLERGRRPDVAAVARERSAKWRVSNRERYLATLKRWYADNATHVKAWQKNYRQSTRGIQREYSKKKKAMVRVATPVWADFEKIREVYVTADFLGMVTGEWYHVDHVIPLKGKINGVHVVCGLHCEMNLQVLTGEANMTKSNTWWPDMP